MGKALTRRSIVLAAPVVCKVPKTRCPVSAAVIGRFHRFQVAQFAHQNHVRVLPQRPAQRLGKAGHINMDLALGDDGLFVFVVILDRVLHGDDVGVVARPH